MCNNNIEAVTDEELMAEVISRMAVDAPATRNVLDVFRGWLHEQAIADLTSTTLIDDFFVWWNREGE